jgi:hypothetical protein
MYRGSRHDGYVYDVGVCGVDAAIANGADERDEEVQSRRVATAFGVLSSIAHRTFVSGKRRC